jgi:hypothetical protein
VVAGQSQQIAVRIPHDRAERARRERHRLDLGSAGEIVVASEVGVEQRLDRELDDADRHPGDLLGDPVRDVRGIGDEHPHCEFVEELFVLLAEAEPHPGDARQRDQLRREGLDLVDQLNRDLHASRSSWAAVAHE